MGLLKRKKGPPSKGAGLIIFADVQEALKAEQVLKRAGYDVRLVAPPLALRKGCDLAVEINVVERFGMERVLAGNDVVYVDIVPVNAATSELLDIVKVTDYGQWVMVRAGNMKVAYDRASGLIVNTSGGGCPDIPYLHAELVDRRLAEAPDPRAIGFTLCALMLHRALEECVRLWNGGDGP